MREHYCPREDSRRSYDVAISAIREQLIRDGKVLPRDGDPIEAQWAREGVRTPTTT
jgi:hypothetical protein